MIKAILFDIDGVLIDSFEANLKFFQNLMIKAGYEPPTRERYQTMFHLTMLDVIRVLVGPVSEDEIGRVRQLGENRAVWYPLELIKMADDVLPTIALLAKTYALGLVTSRIQAGVFSIPQLAPLEQIVKVTVSYEDTIQHKPAAEPLLLAAKKLGLEPSEIVYIGDAETDFQAARAAGMKMIMFANSRVKNADGYVTTFSELPAVIEEMSSSKKSALTAA